MDKDDQVLTSKIVGALLFLVGFGTVFYRMVEGFSWINSFYFTVITLSTVGYGDITPQTDLGKLFTVFYVIVGIGTFAFLVNTLVKRRYENKTKKGNEKK